MTVNRKKIIILQPVFTDYRKPFFDRLNEDFDLAVIHGENKTGVKHIHATYSRQIKSIKLWTNETNRFFRCFSILKREKPDIFIHYFSIGVVSLPFAWLYCKMKGIHFVLWGHGVNRMAGFNPKRSLASLIKLLYLRNADAVILYGNNAQKILAKYVEARKLFVAPNTLDTNSLILIRDKLEKEGIQALKKKLNIPFKYVLIFIGRLLTEKRPDIFLDIIQNLRQTFHDNIGGIIIGDGPERKNIEEKINHDGLQNNMILLGARYDDFLTGQFLFVSDIMLMPGALGLSINHSFCFDCPVVSFERTNSGPFHGPEIEHVINDKTGYLAGTTEELTAWITDYLTNNVIKESIRQNIRLQLKAMSIDTMINSFYTCFNYLDEK